MKKDIIQTTNAPQAIGPYSQAIKVGSWIYTSGQIPIDPKTKEIVAGDIEKQTKMVLENLKAITSAAGGSLDNVVKTTVYITNIDDYEKINNVYGSYFDKGKPARSLVQVAKLPKSVNIEIDAVIYIE
jgi:2-iminobutanoate/2-iminopropanoate deaminase